MTAYTTFSVTLIGRFLIALSLATTIGLMFVACGSASTTQAGPTPRAQTTPTPSPSPTPVAIVHVKIAAQGSVAAAEVQDFLRRDAANGIQDSLIDVGVTVRDSFSPAIGG